MFHYSDASFCNGGFKSQQRWSFYRRKYPLAVRGRNLLAVLQTEFADWLPRLSYIKVDAEGYDRAILSTLLPILRERRPVIRTEVFRKLVAAERVTPCSICSPTLGYRVHRYAGEARPIGDELRRQDMTREKHFDVLGLGAGS